MRKGWFEVAVTLALGWAVIAQGAALLGHFPDLAVELGAARTRRPDPRLVEAVRALPGTLRLTYFVTRREAMPSHMRDVERRVSTLLRRLERLSGGKLVYHVVDPTGDEDLERYASERGVAPVRRRHVERDVWSEQVVWSSLLFEFPPNRPVVLPGIGPEHLPRLQALLRAQIEQIVRPRRPIVALDAPTRGFERLADRIGQKADVRAADLGSGRPLPRDVDVLFWVAPRRAPPAALRALSDFVARGGSVVLAGESIEGAVDEAEGIVRVRRRGGPWSDVLGLFGLAPTARLVLDHKVPTVQIPEGFPSHPFYVASLALDQDFEKLVREPRGTLLFRFPDPVRFDAERLADGGWRAEVLATSSDRTTVLPVGEEGIELAISSIDESTGEKAPKQPLLVLLENADAWRGLVVVAAASNTFADDVVDLRRLANGRLVDVLLDSLASPARLVLARAGIERPAPLPPLDRTERLIWRIFVLGAGPLCLLLVAVGRRRGGRRVSAAAPGWARPLGIAAGGTILVGWIAALSGGGGPVLDLTRDKSFSLSPFTVEEARRAAGDGAVRATYFVSARGRLPPSLKNAAPRLRAALARLGREGAEVEWRVVDPLALPAVERERLPELGVRPLRLTVRREEETVVREVYSTLLLEARGRRTLLVFGSADAFEDLEFRLAFALWRLRTGREAHIAFASDVPRLSAAESYQLYQSRGLIPPSGKDEYQLARSLLEAHDFRVTHVNPRDPHIPADADALVWIQPRRNVQPMLEQFVEYLYRGGKAALFAQHFVIQSRQYRGTGYDFVYWPQPQSPDVENYYFPEIGALLAREVLFDRVHFDVDLPSQINQYQRRRFRDLRLAKPFLVRALARHFDEGSIVMRGVGDLPFLFGAYFRVDEERLAAAGLSARVLATTSDEAWSLLWKGGWIPEECLGDVPPEEKEGVIRRLRRAPLALDLNGTFPWPKKAFQQMPIRVGPDGRPLEAEEPPPYPHPEPQGEGRPGRLLFFGCSEMLKDRWLTTLRPRFRADRLLVNAAASLALPPALAEVAVRRRVVEGIGVVPDAQRTFWRAASLLLWPLALAIVAWVRRRALRSRRLVFAAGGREVGG